MHTLSRSVVNKAVPFLDSEFSGLLLYLVSIQEQNIEEEIKNITMEVVVLFF